MPRPGEVRAPEVRKENLPQGAAALLNAVLPPRALSIAQPDGPGEQSEESFTPASPEEGFLFSGTDRPDEPITAGAPFGPGANFSRFAYESDRDFLGRVSVRLASSPDAPPEVRAFAQRVARGE